MSDTDDTDELLLIPSDFFTVSKHCTEVNSGFVSFYNVVDALITQVNDLKEQIDSIQVTTEKKISLDDLLTIMEPTTEGGGLHHFDDMDDLRQAERDTNYVGGSAQSTPQRPRRTTSYSNSLPNSPGMLLRNRNASSQPILKNPPLPPSSSVGRQESDQVIAAVKTLKKLGIARNLDEHDFAKIGAQQATNDVETDEELPIIEPSVVKRDAKWKCGDRIDSVPNYGLGMRDLMYATHDAHAKEDHINDEEMKKTINPNVQHQVPSSLVDRMETSSTSTTSSWTSQPTTIETSGVVSKRSLQKQQQSEELISLSNLWNKPMENRGTNEQSTVLQQRLQEEKLRRQHCEEVVQQLQNRILELQERVAVAIHVDEVKNTTLSKMQNAMEGVIAKLECVARDKRQLQENVTKMQKRGAAELGAATRKISHYEEEISKALHLAHCCQDKMMYLEGRCQQLEAELICVKNNFDEIQRDYLREVEKGRNYPDIIAEKEMDLNKYKVLMADVRKDADTMKNALEKTQSDLTIVQSQNCQLQDKIQSENSTILDLNQKIIALNNELDSCKMQERSTKAELNKYCQEQESTKVELKSFYQGQVELVVQTKLREFQQQLDQAESNFKNDLKRREAVIAKKAAQHLQQVTEKLNDLEIQLLEQKHGEELNLQHIKLMRCQQDFEAIKRKMQREMERNNYIYKQVARFVEAVKPSGNCPPWEYRGHGLRSKSYSNLEDIIMDLPINYEGATNNTTNDTIENYCKNDSVCDDESKIDTTDVIPIKNSQKNKQQKELEIKNIMDVLLDKLPSNLFNSESSSEKTKNENIEQGMSSKLHLKEKRGDKKPWR